MSAATAFVGAIVEAWSELRVHRTRVLLSLIGVGVAVAALTTVVAGGSIATQLTQEEQERWGGRPATFQVNAFDPESGMPASAATIAPAFTEVAERYGIDYASRSTNLQVMAQLSDGVYGINVTAVDQPYASIHRLQLADGAWFTARDADRLAPAIIISTDLWTRLGSPPLATHPTLEIVTAERTVLAVVTGLIASQPGSNGYDLSGFMLAGPVDELRLSDMPAEHLYTQFEMWLPTDAGEELAQRVSAELGPVLGEGWQVDVYRSDYLAYSDYDPMLPLKLGVGGVALLVLLLGALGLVNIALVTVRYRIREIGIRRSFGATAGRVFFSVMMESVVATAFAGLIGVMLSVALLKNPWTTQLLDEYLQDVPAFPVEAAVVGLLAATGVGALAGLLPALVAVRVKVIDALRL